MAAALTIALWQIVERAGDTQPHPRYVEMLEAAHTLQSASRVIAGEKMSRGLLQSESIDPNRTGFIGSEMTGLTTTIGNLASKRTVTNPDFAAALVRLIDGLELPRGTPVVVVLSGSFLGADVAALAAVEILGLRPIIVASLGASMYGATDPDYNLLDVLSSLRSNGLLKTNVAMAVLGGDKAVGQGMDADIVAKLRTSAARDKILIVDEPPYPMIIDRLLERIDEAVGAGKRAGLVISVGGALVALGTCPESYGLPPGLIRQPANCVEGTPGIPLRIATRDQAPVLHIINIRKLALDLGLPFDPSPLPKSGTNSAIYRMARNSINGPNSGDIR
jgi:poly-gamma-glutamate system protein